ncbi:MBL fold metallo-hydrolase [Virgibacillus halophilus]|uniref:MBL fold metallo-hydrolase n=1 Tax=Tigheibacillus halophilus TaxID=361280 RepID=A0ABU5C8Z6_9BACI|nr:MBL fold metallo-hydrolase [Virgibacillus halophilus]
MRIRHYVLIYGMIVFLVFVPIRSGASAQVPSMKMHFINVGQGDSIFIQTPRKKNILIDGGPPDAGNKVVSYLKKHHVREIDLLISTHPDIDHIGGLPYVLKKIKTKQILDSGKLYNTKTYLKYMEEISQQSIPIRVAKENEKLDIDPSLQIQVLNTYKKPKTNNQSSIALKVSYERMDFLLMSDVDRKQEKRIVKKYNVRSEVLKVPHHGSNTSSSMSFFTGSQSTSGYHYLQ